MESNSLLIGLLGFGTVFFGKAIIPSLMVVCKPHLMKLSFADSLSSLKTRGQSDKLDHWKQQLESAGFTLQGVKTDNPPLWGKAYQELAFVSEQHQSYAGIVLHPHGEPAFFYFYTPLPQGMLFTRNFSVGKEIEAEHISIRNVVSDDCQPVLESHRQRLNRYQLKGMRLTIGESQADRIAAWQQFYQADYTRKTCLINQLPNIVVCLLCLGFLIGAINA